MKKGDTLKKISSKTGIPVRVIAELNGDDRELKAGDTVRLVQAPVQGVEVTGAPPEITGSVLNVTPGDTQTVVDVLVADNRAGELAARAATRNVALVLASGGLLTATAADATTGPSRPSPISRARNRMPRQCPSSARSARTRHRSTPR